MKGRHINKLNNAKTEKRNQILKKNQKFLFQIFCFCLYFLVILADEVETPFRTVPGHNINSIWNRSESLIDIMRGYLDIFLISETKLDGTFLLL